MLAIKEVFKVNKIFENVLLLKMLIWSQTISLQKIPYEYKDPAKVFNFCFLNHFNKLSFLIRF